MHNKVMQFSLVPSVGVVLPHDVGALEFGMAELDARRVAAGLGAVRETFVCGVSWVFSVVLGDLATTVCGGEGGELWSVEISRCGDRQTSASDIAVAYQDVDLFGYPLREIGEVLGPVSARGENFIACRELSLYVSARREQALNEVRPAVSVERSKPRTMTSAQISGYATDVVLEDPYRFLDTRGFRDQGVTRYDYRPGA